MSAEEDDKKHLYEVSDMQQFSDNTGFETKLHISPGAPKEYGWKIFSIIFMAAAIILLILNLIIVSVVAYDVRFNPQECDTTTTTAPATDAVSRNDATVAPVTPNFTCVFQDDEQNEIEMLQRMNNLIKQTEQILSYIDTQGNYIENNTENIGDALDIVRDSADTLDNVVGTLSGIKDNGIITEAAVNDVRFLVDQLLVLQNSTYQTEPTSCQDLKTRQPNSTSGYYHINSQIVYCEMGELCGTEGGGWTRVAYLDMSDSTVDCPGGLRYYQSGGVRACGRQSWNNADCESLKFDTNGVTYSQVCGKVVGWQYGSTDALTGLNNGLDSHYVDGVSITQGFPRKHIWTLASGVFSIRSAGSNCPCNTPPGNAPNIDDFIGDNYFCESGNPNNGWSLSFYNSDPLWDGEDCGSQETNCCAKAGLPWFYRDDLDASTDAIELRICGNSGRNNEDCPVSNYEIYVK